MPRPATINLTNEDLGCVIKLTFLRFDGMIQGRLAAFAYATTRDGFGYGGTNESFGELSITVDVGHRLVDLAIAVPGDTVRLVEVDTKIRFVNDEITPDGTIVQKLRMSND